MVYQYTWREITQRNLLRPGLLSLAASALKAMCPQAAARPLFLGRQCHKSSIECRALLLGFNLEASSRESREQ